MTIPVIIPLLICIALIAITAIIAFTTAWFYSTESKRALVTVLEKCRNLEDLIRLKDHEHDRILKNKEEECTRMANIIQSLMEKNQRLSVDALINQGQESRNNTKS